MGSAEFYKERMAHTAKEAFDALVKDALYESGHGQFSGTIAEKPSFKMIDLPQNQTIDQFVNFLLTDNDGEYSGFNPYNDKWGPAGCIEDKERSSVDKRMFVFFGSASY